MTGSMNKIATSRSYTGRVRTKLAAAAAAMGQPQTIEFVGASDDTIAEAVRFALARASQSLTTLDGAGVLVIPEPHRVGEGPRFRVTLRITARPDPAISPPALAR